MKYEFGDQATVGEIYDHIFSIRTQQQADEYFEAVVERQMRVWNKTRQEAETEVRSNIGYYAGYGTQADRERVALLFNAQHPIFGS